MTVEEQIAKLPPNVRSVVRAARRSVRAAAPEATEIAYQMSRPRSKSMMWKISRYVVDEEPIAGIGAFESHASLWFFRGTDLDDGSGLLQGSGKSRGIRLDSPRDLENPAVKRVLRQAFGRR